MWVNYINPMGILFRGFCGRILCRCFHSRRPTWNCNNNSKRRWRGSEWGGTLQGTNISPKNGILKMIFLFPRWDMLIPWRVSKIPWVIAESDLEPNTPETFKQPSLGKFSSNSRNGRWLYFKHAKRAYQKSVLKEALAENFQMQNAQLCLTCLHGGRMHQRSPMSRFLSQASEKNSELEVMGGLYKVRDLNGIQQKWLCLVTLRSNHCCSNTTISI